MISASPAPPSSPRTTTIAVEEPGFPFYNSILSAEGLHLVPVPVDEDGIDIDVLAATPAAAVLVTPAHQYPYGTVMSPDRRTGLVRWARRHDAWIIEDDYDGEFRFDRQPIGALHGLAADRVIYLGTVSKSLGPGLRIGWVLVPPELHGPFNELRGRTADVSQLEQATLARFIADGGLDRHVRHQRSVYRSRRDQLLVALGSAIDQPDIRGVAAGLHLTLVLPAHIDESALVRQASDDHRLALWGLRQHFLTDSPHGGLVLGYSRSPVDFAQYVTQLSALLRRHERRVSIPSR